MKLHIIVLLTTLLGFLSHNAIVEAESISSEELRITIMNALLGTDFDSISDTGEAYEENYNVYFDCIGQAFVRKNRLNDDPNHIATASLEECLTERSDFVEAATLYWAEASSYHIPNEGEKNAKVVDDTLVELIMSKVSEYRTEVANDADAQMKERRRVDDVITLFIKQKFVIYGVCVFNYLDQYITMNEDPNHIAIVSLGECTSERGLYVKMLALSSSFLTNVEAEEFAKNNDEDLTKKIIGKVLKYRNQQDK